MNSIVRKLKGLISTTNKNTDVERWEQTSKKAPIWDERNKILASHIKAGSSVIDIGAGNMTIKAYLPDNCTYQPIDCVKSSQNTLYAEFNKKIIPDVEQQYDVAVCSGVLEYMVSPEYFIETVSKWSKRMLLSYVTLEYQPDISKREKNGWFNSMTRKELERILSRVVTKYALIGNWHSHSLYEIDC